MSEPHSPGDSRAHRGLELPDALVAEYRASLVGLVPQVELARRSSRDDLKLLAHRTRGVAAMFGFELLGEAAAILEDAILEGHESELIEELTDDFLCAVHDSLDAA